MTTLFFSYFPSIYTLHILYCSISSVLDIQVLLVLFKSIIVVVVPLVCYSSKFVNAVKKRGW